MGSQWSRIAYQTSLYDLDDETITRISNLLDDTTTLFNLGRVSKRLRSVTAPLICILKALEKSIRFSGCPRGSVSYLYAMLHAQSTPNPSGYHEMDRYLLGNSKNKNIFVKYSGRSCMEVVDVLTALLQYITWLNSHGVSLDLLGLWPRNTGSHHPEYCDVNDEIEILLKNILANDAITHISVGGIWDGYSVDGIRDGYSCFHKQCLLQLTSQIYLRRLRRLDICGWPPSNGTIDLRRFCQTHLLHSDNLERYELGPFSSTRTEYDFQTSLPNLKWCNIPFAYFTELGLTQCGKMDEYLSNFRYIQNMFIFLTHHLGHKQLGDSFASSNRFCAIQNHISNFTNDWIDDLESMLTYSQVRYLTVSTSSAKVNANSLDYTKLVSIFLASKYLEQVSLDREVANALESTMNNKLNKLTCVAFHFDLYKTLFIDRTVHSTLNKARQAFAALWQYVPSIPSYATCYG